MTGYYVDTSIWIDFYDDRKGFHGEPLGDYAFQFFSLLSAKKDCIVISDVILWELRTRIALENIQALLLPFSAFTDHIFPTAKEKDEAARLAHERGVPEGDALHAILARNHGLILVTRDKHFRALMDIAQHYRPEDLI